MRTPVFTSPHLHRDTSHNAKRAQKRPRLGRAVVSAALSLSVMSFTGCHLFSEGPSVSLEGSQLSGEGDVQVNLGSSPQAAGAQAAGAQAAGAQAAGAQAAGAQRDSVERSARPEAPPVARVNGVPIPLKRFEQEYEERVKTYRSKGAEVPPRLERTYKLSVMNHLINERLINEAIERAGITLSPQEEQAALEAYQARFQSSKNFEGYLAQSGETLAQVQAKVNQEALLEKLLAREASLEVSERELQDLYDSQKDSRYLEPAKVRLSHLLISLPHNASKRLTQQKTRAARKLLRQAKRKGADFAALAKEHSSDLKSRDRGGELGQISPQGAPKISVAFEEAAAALELNTPSQPVLTEQGWHIIKVTDRQPQQLRVSHILLKGPKAEQRAKELLKRAESEPFEELARAHSQDEPSRVRGGDIGFLHPKSAHRLGPTFQEGVFKHQRGDLALVMSPLGAHVILITEARPERLRASHILLSLPPKPSKALVKQRHEEALALLEELKREQLTGRGASAFTALARRSSDDKLSQHRGGDLGVFFVGGQPHFSRAFEELAFSLKRGEVGGPVRSPLGLHLIKVTEHLEARQTSLHEARAELTEQLKAKKIRSARALLMQRLRSEARVERLLDVESPQSP